MKSGRSSVYLCFLLKNVYKPSLANLLATQQLDYFRFPELFPKVVNLQGSHGFGRILLRKSNYMCDKD